MKSIVLLLALLFSYPIFAGDPYLDSLNYKFETLAPEPQHTQVSQVIAHLLTQMHYKKRSLDDSLSSEVFDRYLEKLDGNKLYFLESDIHEFEKHRYNFDDYIRSGNLRAPFAIFTIYQKRFQERMEYVFQRLERPFDFSKDEYIELDREDMPWPKTAEELDEAWRKRIKHQALNLKIAGKEWPDIQKTLRKRYKRTIKNISQSQPEDIFQILMNSLAESYDPHTNYFSPKNYDDFKIRMSQSLEGIGARLSSEDDYTKVVDIITGGPADKSNLLHPNDRITGVGQGEEGEIVDVIGWRLDDVVQMIRGRKGTVVRLEVLRADAPAGSLPDTIAIVRDKVKLEDQSAKADTLHIIHEGEKRLFGVITVPVFYSDYEARRRGERDYKSTSRDVRKLLEELKAEGVEGVIIDLRRNGGGFLNEAVDLTGLFIDEGPVVQVRSSSGRVSIERDNDPGITYDGPLLVLIDRLSASASEIFAAAIQDYKRGLVVGSQSFGKGTVQNAVGLNRYLRLPSQKLGQLKLTVAKFYRINGGSTQHVGVVPDISFPSRFNFAQIGESARENALLWDQIAPVKYQEVSRLERFLPELKKRHDLRAAVDPVYRKTVEEYKEIKAHSNDSRLTLNEEQRRAERAKRNDSDEDDPEEEKEEKDAFLLESAHILGDLIALLHRQP